MKFFIVLVVFICATLVGAFITPPKHGGFSRSSSFLKATAGEAISSMDASQGAVVGKISGAIPDLVIKPDLSWAATDGVTLGGSLATLQGMDAPGKSNVAWLASVNVADRLSSLTIFNGPLTDVPHLLSRCIVNSDNTISFTMDFRPRAYGAYEMVDAEGNYPGPDKLGRDAFVFSGNRKEYDTKFGTEEVVAFVKATAASFEGASPSGAAPTEFELLTNGPLALSMTMPLTDGNVAAVIAARERAADLWLRWALEDTHAHRPGAPINTQYVYDSKFRQNAYSALLPAYSAAFGAADGAKLSAAESGPLDEGYVGGGS